MRLSAGVVIVRVVERKLRFLLLRSWRNWDFPKGLVEPGEQPIDAALEHEGVSRDELLAGLRKLGYDSPERVRLAVLEETGAITAIERDGA